MSRVHGVLRHGVAAVAATALLMLAGCSVTETDASVSASPSTTASASPTPDVSPSSADPQPGASTALLRVEGRATAPNGAAIDVTVTLDTLPAANAAMLAEATAGCWLRDPTWPTDVASALFWQQTVTAEPVSGTPAWPASQQLWMLSLAAQGIATGDSVYQLRTGTPPVAQCSSPDVGITIAGPGTGRVVLFEPPSSALIGFGVDESIALGQYGFASGGAPEFASTITDCVVTVAPEIEAARARVGLPWRVLADYAPWAEYGDFCGIGVPNEEIP